jgi:hypothetical protein
MATSQMSITPEEQSDAQSLISRYARSLDACDVPGVLECFTDNVSLSYEDGRIVITGRAQAEAFLSGALRGPSTHLLSNFGFERPGPAIVVTCSAIACVCRKQGVVTLRGLIYLFTCVGSESGLRIQKLRHSLKWECDAPGGLPSR